MQAIAGTLELFDAAHVWMSQIPMDVPMDDLETHAMHEMLNKFKRTQFVKQSLVVFDIAELCITSKNTIGGSGNCMSLMLHIRLVSQSRHVTCA